MISIIKVDNSRENKILVGVESALRYRVQKEEAEYGSNGKPSNSLWGHSERVAVLAEHLERIEGVDPLACRLVSIFHDTGKSGGGSYHKDDEPEEKRSVAVFLEITRGKFSNLCVTTRYLWQLFYLNRYKSRKRLRPGRVPVWLALSTTRVPLTMTNSTPLAYANGFSLVDTSSN